MTQPHDDDSRIVEIYTAANEIDAGAIRAALEQQGIEAKLVGDLLGNAFDVPLGFTGPRIWVHENDATAARRIVEQLQSQLGDETAEMDTLDVGEPDGDESPE